MKKTLLLPGLLLIVLFVPHSVADSIKIGDKVYEDVVVINDENSSLYFVCLPNEGKTLSEFKSRVDPRDVAITKDKEKRSALLKEYEKARQARSPYKKTSMRTRGELKNDWALSSLKTFRAEIIPTRARSRNYVVLNLRVTNPAGRAVRTSGARFEVQDEHGSVRAFGVFRYG